MMTEGETIKYLKYYDCNSVVEDYTHNQIMNTVRVLKELDFAEKKSLKPLYNYKLASIKEN